MTRSAIGTSLIIKAGNVAMIVGAFVTSGDAALICSSTALVLFGVGSVFDEVAKWRRL
jgi:hypothetical protein